MPDLVEVVVLASQVDMVTFDSIDIVFHCVSLICRRIVVCINSPF